jgi:hypothetical protein
MLSAVVVFIFLAAPYVKKNYMPKLKKTKAVDDMGGKENA